MSVSIQIRPVYLKGDQCAEQFADALLEVCRVCECVCTSIVSCRLVLE
jgi:hypothetical protein